LPEKSSQKIKLGPAGPAIISLAILASFFLVPIAGPFMALVLPAPLAYSRLKYGQVNFAMAAALCLALASAGDGFPIFTGMTMGLSICGYVLAGSMKKGDRYDRVILSGALVPLLIVGPLAGLYFLAAGADPWALMSATLDQGTKESVNIYRQMGMSQKDIDAIMPSLVLFKKVVMGYLPAILVSLMAWVSFLSYILVRGRTTMEGLTPGQDGRMNVWIAPDHAVWGVIVPGFLLIPPVPPLREAAGNLLAAFALVYMFQGMAIVSFFFEKFKLSRFFRWLGWALIVMQPLLSLVVCCAGLSDTWADFRKLRPGKPK